MSLDSQIVVASGLPRSGTSLLMQMLDAGGLEVVSDHVRAADVDNPRGYFELERVKQIQKDDSWLPAMRGKAFKLVSQLLYHLPPTEAYLVIFMRRNLEEVIASQEKMLQRRKAPAAPRAQIAEAFRLHLTALFQWLVEQRNMAVLEVDYNDLVREPHTHAQRIAQFLGEGLDVEAMRQAVLTDLYRNRVAASRNAQPRCCRRASP